MGLHGRILYDAWSTTPPEDLRPASRFTPSTVESAVEINLDSGLLEPIGTYDVASGNLINVQIGGWSCSPDIFAQIVGPEAFARQETLSPARLDDLAREAAADAEADWADHQNDLRRDH